MAFTARPRRRRGLCAVDASNHTARLTPQHYMLIQVNGSSRCRITPDCAQPAASTCLCAPGKTARFSVSDLGRGADGRGAPTPRRTRRRLTPQAPVAVTVASGSRHATRRLGVALVEGSACVHGRKACARGGPRAVRLSARALFGAERPLALAGGNRRQGRSSPRCSRSLHSRCQSRQPDVCAPGARLQRPLPRACAQNPPRSPECARLRADERAKARPRQRAHSYGVWR